LEPRTSLTNISVMVAGGTVCEKEDTSPATTLAIILTGPQTLGRRPVYLLGSLFFIPCTVWMALSPSYISFAIANLDTCLGKRIPDENGSRSNAEQIVPNRIGDQAWGVRLSALRATLCSLTRALGHTFGVSPGLIPNTIGYNLLVARSAERRTEKRLE
jgi:hypothetical protein